MSDPLPESIVRPEELDYYIQSIHPIAIADIGTTAWIKLHETVLKLLQQANVEMRTHQEESVKELIVVHDKLPALVHECFAVLLWRTKVLPKLLAIEPQPATTFALYTVLFHEATALQLIESVLFHENGCQALNETSVDLIDYCAQAVVQLIALAHAQDDDDEDDNGDDDVVDLAKTADDLRRQQRDMLFKLGMRCVSVLCYIVDKLDVMSLSAATRLVRTHDMPCVLAELLHCAPWMRRRRDGMQRFADDRWQTVRGDAVLRLGNTEAQTWLCMRQMLFNATVARNYPITEFRQRELAKCQALMTELLLDQLPPLAELKHYLCTLQVTGGQQRETLGQQVMLEEMPQVRERLVAQAKRGGGWSGVVELQAQVFLHKSVAEVQRMAQQLNDSYGADVWERLEERKVDRDDTDDGAEKRECVNCQQSAQKKCYQCKEAFYCCRECQVKDWPRHKTECQSLNK